MSIVEAVMETSMVEWLVAAPSRKVDLKNIKFFSVRLRVGVAVATTLVLSGIYLTMAFFGGMPLIFLPIVFVGTLIFSVLLTSLVGTTSLNAYRDLEIADGKVSGKNFNVAVENWEDPDFSYKISDWFKRQVYFGLVDGLVETAGGMILLVAVALFTLK